MFVARGIYLPILLIDLFSLTAIDAGQRAAGFVILATAIRPIGGLIADKFSPKMLLSISFIVIAACAVFLAFFNSSIILFTIFCLTLAVFAGLGNGVVFKIVPLVSPTNTGAVTGIVGAAGGIGGFFPPIILGVVKDMTGNFFFGFILLAAFSVMCLIINMSRKSLAN